jgi:hypothetical protein
MLGQLEGEEVELENKVLMLHQLDIPYDAFDICTVEDNRMKVNHKLE